MSEDKKGEAVETKSVEAKVEPKKVAKTANTGKTVKMTRGDRSADVHPDMVSDYSKGGWTK